jgi:hypothetical protein
MREATANAALTLLRIANAEDWPVVHRSLEKVDKILEESGYLEIVELRDRLINYLEKRKTLLRPEVLSYLERLKKGKRGHWGF